MEKNDIPYVKQIFVCTNNRHGEKPSCADQNGQGVFTELRRIAKERGLHPKVRVAQATCLGQCASGVTVMIYPDNVWYKKVQEENIKELADMHIKK